MKIWKTNKNKVILYIDSTRENIHQDILDNCQKYSIVVNNQYWYNIFRGSTLIYNNNIPSNTSLNNIIRDRYRICYIGNTTNGLYDILRWFYPIIKKQEPKITLHLYINFKDSDDYIIQSLNQDGIAVHSYKEEYIHKEFAHSSFMLCFTNNFNKINYGLLCQSMFMGCMPIITSNANILYPITNCLSVDNLNPGLQEDHKKLVNTVLTYMNDNKLYDDLSKIKDTVMTSEECAKLWTTIF